MKRLTAMTIAALLAVCCCTQKQQVPEVQDIIFENDMGNDVDDVLALGIIYKYVDEGKVNLLGISSNKVSPFAADWFDIFGTWYGHADVPVAVAKNGPECKQDDFVAQVCSMTDGQGAPFYKRSHKVQTEEPVAMYRRILSSRPDNSVNIISAGFFTNLSALMESPADGICSLTGKELIEQKVRTLICTGCLFSPGENPEFNVRMDIPAAQNVLHNWPTEVIVSPVEVGSRTKYPASSIENDFPQDSPLVTSYKAFKPMPYDRSTWDLTAIVYLMEGDRYFRKCGPGIVLIDEKGNTRFHPTGDANRYILTIDEDDTRSILDRYIELLTK